MTISDLIHVIYKTFGADAARLIDINDKHIDVEINGNRYQIDIDLDVWLKHSHGRARGRDENRISSSLLRTRANWNTQRRYFDSE